MTPSIKQRIEQIQCGEVPEGYSMERAMLYPNDWGTPVRLNTILWENKTRNEDMCYDKKDVLSVSGEQGIVNQIELMGRSYAGESVAPYHVVETSDIVYTKSPLKDNPYGIIKQNKGKPGIVSTLYAVYHCKNPIIGQYIENYFSIDTNLNNYLKPLVKRGAKNDMKVNNEDVLLGRIPLPRIEEQQRINVVIAHIDHIIELKQKLIDELKKLKKVCLEKMFPQKGNSVPEIRFPGFTAPWEQRKFSDLVLIERGGSPRPIDDYITDAPDGLNWVKIGDAPEQGRYITKTAEKIKPEGLSKTRQVQPGDLILSNSMSFGKPYIMGIDGCIHDGWLLIRDTLNRFDLKFLCHMLGTNQMLDQYKMFAAGSTVNNLNKELVGNTTVSLPSIEEQRVVGAYLENIDNLITLHQRELEVEQQKKKALMKLLLTGIVRTV